MTEQEKFKCGCGCETFTSEYIGTSCIMFIDDEGCYEREYDSDQEYEMGNQYEADVSQQFLTCADCGKFYEHKEDDLIEEVTELEVLSSKHGLDIALLFQRVFYKSSNEFKDKFRTLMEKEMILQKVKGR